MSLAHAASETLISHQPGTRPVVSAPDLSTLASSQVCLPRHAASTAWPAAAPW